MVLRFFKEPETKLSIRLAQLRRAFQSKRKGKRGTKTPQHCVSMGPLLICAAMKIAKQGMCCAMPASSLYKNALPCDGGALDVTLICAKEKGRFLYVSVRETDMMGAQKMVFEHLRRKGQDPITRLAVGGWSDCLLNAAEPRGFRAKMSVPTLDQSDMAAHLMHGAGLPATDIR